jgi:hypothetical protein
VSIGDRRGQGDAGRSRAGVGAGRWRPACTPGSWRVVATDPADRANPALPLRQLQDSPYSGWLFESHASWMTHELPEFRTTTHCSVLSVD